MLFCVFSIKLPVFHKILSNNPDQYTENYEFRQKNNVKNPIPCFRIDTAFGIASENRRDNLVDRSVLIGADTFYHRSLYGVYHQYSA